jgi:hypothetical protein
MKRQKEEAVRAIREGRPRKRLTYALPDDLVLKLPRREYGWVGALSLRVHRLGTDAAPRKECLEGLQWRGLPRSPRARYEAATTLERGVGATWFLSPQITERLTPGCHEITATYDATGVMAGARELGGKLTATATFEVLPPPVTPQEKLDFAFARAVYALTHEDFDGCIRFAQEMVDINPRYERLATFAPYYYLGRGYEAKGMLREALVAYEAYLAIVQDVGISGVPREVRARAQRIREKLQRAEE